MGSLISGSISLPSPGFFSPFPHGTGCTIGDKSYLALPSGLGRFTRGSTCSVLLRCLLQFGSVLRYGAVTHSGQPFQAVLITLLDLFLATHLEPNVCLAAFARFEGESGGGPTTPADESTGLGSSAFARRYLRNLFDFFSSAYLDVSVQPVPSSWTMYSSKGDEVLPRRVPPFGNPRIKALVQLPWAFRRLRVLLRQLVPRHSSMTLFSLKLLAALSSARCLVIVFYDRYSAFKVRSIVGSSRFVFSTRLSLLAMTI